MRLFLVALAVPDNCYSGNYDPVTGYDAARRISVVADTSNCSRAAVSISARGPRFHG